MRLRFWKKENSNKPEPSSEKDRLLHYREILLEASYHIRILEKVSTRYFARAADVPKVKNLFWDMVGDVDYGKIWKEISDIEEILHTKYHIDFMNAGHLEDLRIDLLTTNIRRAEYTHDGSVQTVQSEQPAVN
jgi:hypothetical protein